MAAGAVKTLVTNSLGVVTAATKGPIDDVDVSFLDTDITLAANSDAKSPTQKAIKAYVDNYVSSGVSWKAAVRAATIAAGTLATSFENGDVIDGVTLVTGDRLLIKNQAAGAENGLYLVAASGAPTRTTDADTGAELVSATVMVREGTVNADTQWTCSNDAVTLGSTSIAFAQISGAGTYSAGSGLTLTGNQFSIGAGQVVTSMLAASLSLTTPTLGVAAATSINKVAITAPATSATLTIDDGVTLHATGNVTALSGAHTGSSSGTNTGDQTNIAGNAATVTTNANLTGPVTSTGNATAIANGALTDAMLASTYALLAGRSGGQVLFGGTGSGDNLTLKSTSHATKGKVVFGNAGTSAYDEVNDRWGFRTATPATPIHMVGVDGTTSYIINTLSGGTSGYGVFQQFTDGAVYNSAFGAMPGGDFAWFVGRFPGTAGSQVMRLAYATGNLGVMAAPDQRLIVAGTNYDFYVHTTFANTLNFGYSTNSLLGGWVNYVGYQAGTTQFRDFTIGNGKNTAIAFFQGSTGSVVIGTAALATNATGGFLYIPTCAGTPNGTATDYTGRVPMVYDSTNFRLYFHIGGGSWYYAQLNN